MVNASQVSKQRSFITPSALPTRSIGRTFSIVVGESVPVHLMTST